ncbi:non-specific serine/threonine protein kinase [Malassezia cuniculi]|uniref:Non-specific serine/threonine protein kinase n=1 Tax=Malassezia cuniculi TaxID=948313 RepID=A0AAF0ENK3_9BASI|nr:non-specific serine/threonine protein kinase [Malassezia cuniculi]
MVESDAVRETRRLQLQTHTPSGRRMVNQYIVEDEIGHGVHGRVRCAYDAQTNERVALKIVEREARARLGAPRPSPGIHITDEKVLREIAILKKCRHKNIVQLREVIDDPHSRKIFMVLEYMEGGEIIWRDEDANPVLTVDEARKTIRDVVLGLEYLHYQGIVHRDIKPANLLWDKQHTVKISDFGVSYLCAAQRGEDGARDEVELSKTAGSPAFFAPELCMANEDGKCPPITRSIDVWALGITLYCLLFGAPPFTAESEYALFSVIPQQDYALPEFMGSDRVRVGPRAPRWASEGQVRSTVPDAPESALPKDALLLRDLLDRLLEKDPRKRITLDEVKKHPWIVRTLQDAGDWLDRTDPANQPSVEVCPQDVEQALTGFSRIKQQIRRLHTMLADTLRSAQGLSVDAQRGGTRSTGTVTPMQPAVPHLSLASSDSSESPGSGIASAPANVLSLLGRRGSGASTTSARSRASSITATHALFSVKESTSSRQATQQTAQQAAQQATQQVPQHSLVAPVTHVTPATPTSASPGQTTPVPAILQAGCSAQLGPAMRAAYAAPTNARGAPDSNMPPAVPVSRSDLDYDCDDLSDLSDTSDVDEGGTTLIDASDESDVGINFSVRPRH